MKKSLDKDDILFLSNKLDKNNNSVDFSGLKRHQEILLLIPKMLGFDLNELKLHYFFDENKKARCVYLELDKDYILNINDNIINFRKGEMIQIWMHKLSTTESFLEQIKTNKLDLIQLTTATGGNHALFICKIA